MGKNLVLFAGILKVPPSNQQLFKENQIMEDDKTLQDYGLTSNSAKAQCPGSVGLAFRWVIDFEVAGHNPVLIRA